MQIQLITTHEEMQETFNRMFAEAIKVLPTNEPSPLPTINTGEELCKQLGVTIQTLIRWKHKGNVPFMQIGSSIRYDLNKVLQTLENKKAAK
jgi:excisionase family DNA binding protein